MQRHLVAGEVVIDEEAYGGVDRELLHQRCAHAHLMPPITWLRAVFRLRMWPAARILGDETLCGRHFAKRDAPGSLRTWPFAKTASAALMPAF